MRRFRRHSVRRPKEPSHWIRACDTVANSDDATNNGVPCDESTVAGGIVVVDGSAAIMPSLGDEQNTVRRIKLDYNVVLTNFVTAINTHAQTWFVTLKTAEDPGNFTGKTLADLGDEDWLDFFTLSFSNLENVSESFITGGKSWAFLRDIRTQRKLSSHEKIITLFGHVHTGAISGTGQVLAWDITWYVSALIQRTMKR